MPYDTELGQIGPPDAPAAIAPPPAVSAPQQYATNEQIGQAVGQLNAGQPVTSLPHQDWSPQEAQTFSAKLNAFDQQAKAASAAAQQAAIDAQMFEQMSRVAKSTKDIEIARRNIDVMGLQRDIQSGVPIHEAVARHPMGLGSGFGSALKATAPALPPTKLQLPGMPAAVVAGGRPYWPPASAMEKPPLSTDAVPIKDPEGKILGYRAQIGPSTGTLIRNLPEGKLNDIDKMRLGKAYADRASIEKDIGAVSPELQATEGWKSMHQGEINRLSKTQSLITELETKYGVQPTAAASAAPSKTIAVLGSGTKTDPAKPESKEQFDSVKPGMWFVNPKDGKLLQKK